MESDGFEGMPQASSVFDESFLQKDSAHQLSKGLWYSHTFVRFELVKQLQHKYMSYMFYNENAKPKPKWMLRRYFFGYSIRMLDSAFEKMGNLYDKRVYADLAYWNEMLAFTWDIRQVEDLEAEGGVTNKRSQQKDDWEIRKKKEICGFDWGFDFDAIDLKHWQSAYKHCSKVMGFFDGLDVPYSVNWSGSKGFHLRINQKHLPLKWNSVKKIRNNLFVAEFLRQKFKLGTLDLQIYDMDRVFKLCYSIDGKTGLVVLPLDRAQYNNFYPSMCYPENVLKSVMIKNRGLVEMNKGNCQRLFKEVGLR